jgi:protease secretion system membrane fusion protein
VQHLAGGIVQAVLVREGQTVQAGDLLLRLDDAPASANREAVRQRYLALRAHESRLRAEQAGASRITWHADLAAADASAEAQGHQRAQQDLFSARRQALAAELQAIEESLQAQRGLLDTAQRVAASRQQQLQLVRDELQHLRTLVAEGYAPRNRQLELERQEAEALALISELQGQQARARSAMAELAQRAAQRKSEERRDSSQQLAEVLRDVQAEAERLRAVQADLGRTELRAPVSGQVVGLAVQTPGTVVEPARTLMSIVPADEALVIDTQVPPHFIDRVQPGQAVDARFQSFAHTPQLVVAARVQSVSADRLVDPATQQAYYLARVVVTAEGRQLLGERRLQPGMPAEVVFKTGERTLLTYWLAPLTKRLASAMKEE